MLVTSNFSCTQNVFKCLLTPYSLVLFKVRLCDRVKATAQQSFRLVQIKRIFNNKSNVAVAHMMISDFHAVENIAGERENAGHQHVLLFPQGFSMHSLELLKVRIVSLRV